MDFFNEFGKKLTKTSQTVAKKAKDVAETGNLKLQVREEERILKGIFTELGEKYYAVYGQNPDPAMAEIVETVDASYRRIGILKENIAKLENERTCAKCGSKMPEKGMFCPACGEKYPEPEEEAEEVEYHTCSACGAQVLDGAAFCTKCGEKQEKTVEVPSEEKVDDVVEPVEAEQPEESETASEAEQSEE